MPKFRLLIVVSSSSACVRIINMDKKIVIGFIIIVALILGGIVFVTARSAAPNPQLSVFAQCLKEKGAVFYGAYWCSHCQATKRMFGSAASDLPYVECSTPDGNGQTQICKDKKIAQYPTWRFADGSELTGQLSLAQLSTKTGCIVPGSPEAAQSDASNNSDAADTNSAVVPVETLLSSTSTVAI